MEIALFSVGLVAVGAVVWFFARYRLQGLYLKQIDDLQSMYLKQIAELEGRARGAEAVVGELRQHIHNKESEIDQLRSDLNDERQLKVESVTNLGASRKQLEEQKELIEVMKSEMTDTFNALSSAALKSSSEDFIRLASEHLGKIVSDTKGKLGEHQAAMDGTIRPLQEMLRQYDEQLRAIEKSRHESFGSLSQQIRALSTMHEQLQRETSNLVTALRKPQVSGSWGQLSLRRSAELAGMTAYCDFFEQESVSTSSGRLRPDMIVRLPNKREIVIDAKAPVDAYLNITSSFTDEERRKAITNYVTQVRNHMNALGSKSYWDQFTHSPELVVMFLPGESFFSAALEHDPKLIEDGSMKKVILATPTTFIALLKAIAYGWQQEQMTKNAQEISKLGKELYERFSIVIDHFSKTGASLQRAVASYNEGANSLSSRLIPTIKKFKELGISSQKDISSLSEVDQTTRSVEHMTLQLNGSDRETVSE